MFTLTFELPTSPRPFVYYDDRITGKTVVSSNARMTFNSDIVHIRSTLKIETFDKRMEIRGITDAPVKLYLDCEEE